MSFQYRNLSSDEWIQQYSRRKALWIHDGNPLRPHAILSKGGHSSGFFNGELVLQDPRLMDHATYNLVASFNGHGLKVGSINRVIGPAMGAITLAHDVARHAALRSGNMCLRGYVQKGIDAEKKDFMFFERTEIEEREQVLLAEDTITSGGSVLLAAEAVRKAGGILLPYIACLVNRSGLEEVGGFKIISLISHHMPVWQPGSCLLCDAGSEALPNVKKLENWARLNASYS